jgi:hypothetical protein
MGIVSPLPKPAHLAKLDEARDDLKHVLRILEALVLKLDATASGIRHKGIVDNRPHLGPSEPCPTCDLEREQQR